MKTNELKKVAEILFACSILLMLFSIVIFISRNTLIFEGEEGDSFFVCIGIMFGMGFSFFIISIALFSDILIGKISEKRNLSRMTLLILIPLLFSGCGVENRMEYYSVKCPFNFVTLQGTEDSYFFEARLCMRNEKVRVVHNNVTGNVILTYKGPLFEKTELIASDVLKYQQGKIKVSLISENCPKKRNSSFLD